MEYWQRIAFNHHYERRKNTHIHMGKIRGDKRNNKTNLNVCRMNQNISPSYPCRGIGKERLQSFEPLQENLLFFLVFNKV